MAVSEKTRKILDILTKIFTLIVVAVTVCMMIFTIISVSLFDKNDRALFGTKFYIVMSPSMSLSENNKHMDVHFDEGDIVLVKDLTIEEKYELDEGDIISFVSMNEDSYGKTITHMIKSRKYDTNGKFLGYKTFGTNTGSEDLVTVEPEFVLGEYSSHIPKIGHFFNFMKTVPGYIVCILVPFLLLIGYQLINVIRLYRKYRSEQNAIIEAERAEMAEERAKLEEQRLQSMKMMEELAALKEQLAQGGVSITSGEAKTEIKAEESEAVSSDAKTEDATADNN